MIANIEPTIDEVVLRAHEIFRRKKVRPYLADHGDEFRSTERPFEAGDAIQEALAELGTNVLLSEYDARPPADWPEAEELLKAQIPDYDQEIERREKLCRDC